MNQVLWLLLAHFAGEFLGTTEALRQQKRNPSRRTAFAYLHHGCLMGGLLTGALAFSTRGAPLPLLLCALILVLLHLGIDVTKYVALYSERPLAVLQRFFGDFDRGLYQTLVFICVQILHVVALTTVAGLFFRPAYDLRTVIWYFQHHLWGTASIPTSNQLPYVLLLGLLGTVGLEQPVSFLLQSMAPQGAAKKVTITETTEHVPVRDAQASAVLLSVPPDKKNRKRKPAAAATPPPPPARRVQRTEEYEEAGPPHDRVSRVIGILERALAMLLIAQGAWPVLAAVLGIKAVARYKRLDEQGFATYYLAGTWLSLLLGIGFGLLIRKALSM